MNISDYIRLSGGNFNINDLVFIEKKGVVGIRRSFSEKRVYFASSERLEEVFINDNEFKVEFNGIPLFADKETNLLTPFKSDISHIYHEQSDSFITVAIFSLSDFEEYSNRPDIFKPLDLVIYVPGHANNDVHHSACQKGVVSSVRLNRDLRQSVYVRYTEGSTAALTPTKNLKKR